MEIVRALLLLLVGAAALAQAPDEMVRNGGFEGTAEGLVPPWVDNSYGENTVRYAISREAPREGEQAQRIVCERLDDGAAQFYAPGMTVEQGRTYTITLWARGEIDTPLYCGFRKYQAPYTRYLISYLRIGPDWRRYQIIGEAAESDPECGLYFSFQSEGWLEVDAVSARPGAHPEPGPQVDLPPVKGNRVANASFELGVDDWSPLNGGLERCDGDAPHGDRHLRVGGKRLEGRPFVTTPGQVYTLSAWLRRPAGPAEATLELTEYTDGGGDHPTNRGTLSTTVTVGPDWRRVHVTGAFDAHFTVGAFPRFRFAEAGFEVDAVQVEEGELTDFAPRAATELAARVPMAARYPAPGQPVPIAVAAAGEPPARLSVRVVDLWDREVSAFDVAGDVGGFEVTPPGPGLYRVEVRAAPDGPPADVLLGVLPAADEARARADGFHGIHAPPSVDPESPDLAVQVAVRAGFTRHRIHDFANYVQWYWVEPNQGDRVWFDPEIDHLRDAGLDLLGTLARTPQWAARPELRDDHYTASPPRDMAEFQQYVRDTVGHYRGRIDEWEIWNEPYGKGFFIGTAEEYAAVLTAGSAAVREADPEATVVGICAYTGMADWIDRVLAASGTAAFDVFSYHRYYRPAHAEERDGEPPLAVAEVETIRELMRRHGGERPIWQSEGGVACPTFHAWRPPDGFAHDAPTAARAVARLVTLLRSAGVERWFYYYMGYPYGGRGDYTTLGNAAYILMDFDGSPKATLMALAAASQRLGHAQFRERIAAGDLRAYVFVRGGDPLAVVWTEGDAPPRPVSLPAGVVAHNLMGLRIDEVTLGPDPVYLEGDGVDAAVRAWGG